MSSGGALVRFPDGAIYTTIYTGTSDILYGELDQIDEYIGFDLLFSVEIWTNYGAGFWWRGWATRREVAPESCVPYGLEGEGGVEIYPSIETFDGEPQWVTDYYDL